MDISSDLSRKQTRLLKKLLRSRVIRQDKHNVDDLQYLYDLGLITVVSCPKEDDYYFEATGLTERGKAALDNKTLWYRDRLVPYAALILSIISIVISILALILQFLDLGIIR